VALITLLPILIIFLLAQRTFIEGANISGLGGR
jgi:ABC-type glycerol-3-phosphate transport system permease component